MGDYVGAADYGDETTDMMYIDCPQESVPGFCSPIFDQIICWPLTPANSTAAVRCPNLISNVTIINAYRYCPVNASWEDAKSNYTACINIDAVTPVVQHSCGGNIEAYPDPEVVRMAEILRDVYFILSAMSLVLLFITIFIFSYFRSLHCSRISIHKHLVVSFIFRFILNIVMVEPYISRRHSSYRDLDWLCKTFTAIAQYTTLSNVFWMFVEGFFLHHSLVLGVFSTEPPFKLFYFIGWGFPAVFVISWSLTLQYLHDCPCWLNYSQLEYYYIITVPFITALAVNLVFLVNIIRVLVSKLRANNRIESANIRKAIKATVVLMPLLGLTNLLFITSPGEGATLQAAYHVTNAVLQSSQGIFVAILYCFMNGEVRRVIKQKWYRFRMRHVLRGSGRRRSSRTSSFFLPSGTEDDETTDKVTQHNAADEQLRLLQANLALQNETIMNRVTPTDTNHVVTNGTSGSSTPIFKKNNNNGEVHFDLGPTSDIERETVL